HGDTQQFSETAHGRYPVHGLTSLARLGVLMFSEPFPKQKNPTLRLLKLFYYSLFVFISYLHQEAQKT
ncbi:MAG: hypothetical protein CMO75_00005, partial [Verrucomicrobiales bacterium]|nr:hypothetical protein [Verrucomicrobiales bacterium]